MTSKNSLTVKDFSDQTITPSDLNCWEDFVSKNVGNYCQRIEWQEVLSTSYRLDTHFLMISEAETPVGVLPLAVIRSPFGRKAVSLPYCNYGGFLVSEGADKNQVVQAALAYLKMRGINRVEIRELCSAADDDSSSSEVTMLLDLPESEELLWKKIGQRVRNKIRNTERAGLVPSWGRDQVTELYDIYAANMGRLGTPVHARAFVDEILSVFGERADILTVRFEGQAVAAMLVLKHADIWIDPIVSSRSEFNHMNPNMLLHWEALRQATLAGAKLFDFGRSKVGSGTHRFKRQWGSRAVPLDYHSYIDGVRVNAASTDAYRGGKAALITKMWSKLPSQVQRYFGPIIRRYIP